MNKNFKYMCMESGVADFMYVKKNKDGKIINNTAPIWMTKYEAKLWTTGYNYAREQCRSL